MKIALVQRYRFVRHDVALIHAAGLVVRRGRHSTFVAREIGLESLDPGLACRYCRETGVFRENVLQTRMIFPSSTERSVEGLLSLPLNAFRLSRFHDMPPVPFSPPSQCE